MDRVDGKGRGRRFDVEIGYSSMSLRSLSQIAPHQEGDNAVDDDTLGTLPSFSSYNYLNSGDSVTGSSLTRRPTPHPSKFTSKGGSGAAELKASAAMEAYNRTEAAMLYGNEKGEWGGNGVARSDRSGLNTCLAIANRSVGVQVLSWRCL